jgi:hypothetical protein
MCKLFVVGEQADHFVDGAYIGGGRWTYLKGVRRHHFSG